jgi:alkylresorcinol/alkylpyrone synthase
MMGGVIATEPRPDLSTLRSGGTPAVSITGLATSLPQYRVEGAELLAALGDVWPRLRRRLRQFHPELEGGTRYLVRPTSEFATPMPLEEQRFRYIQEATQLAVDAAQRALGASGCRADEIGLLVVSSCTGFVLPGVDVHLVERLSLPDDVRRMPFAHFGCAGGAAALAHAADWVRRDDQRRALVVAVEVPSITFRPVDTSPDNLLSALVFGDGAAAVVLSAGSAAAGLFELRESQSRLVPGTRDALGFEVLGDGFRVIVSRRLPELFETRLPAIVDAFSDAMPAGLDAVAIHPGGRTIVDTVARVLELHEAQTAASRRSRERNGNSSSAALLFVLQELASDPPAPAGRGLAIGFGPGLTVELFDFSWRH